jgi:hypothetical protein
MEDIIRQPVELIDEDLDEVAGGFFNFSDSNVGIGQINFGWAEENVNIGVGQVNIDN